MKQRDLIKKLESLGYELDRTGDHMIYAKEGRRDVEVPNHREINENTARAILKAAGRNSPSCALLQTIAKEDFMSSYVYTATFHPNDDGSFTILFPDLPGCISEGKSLENALYMAQDALKTWAEYSIEHGKALPAATPLGSIKLEDGDFANLIRAEVRDEGAVRRTVSIPRWMDEAASAESLSLSRVLQDALREKLGVA